MNPVQVAGALCSVLLAALPASASGPSLEVRLRQLLHEPDELPGLRLVSADIGEDSVTLGLEVPSHVALDDLPPAVENRLEIAAGAINALSNATAIHLLVRHPGEALRPPPRRARNTPPAPKVSPSIAPDPSRFPFGQALRGKTIALSPGHGYIYYDNLGRYSTQRGRIFWNNCGDCRGIVEDFETHEIVIEHLIPLLEGAGAKVILVRERSYSPAGAISDDGGAEFTESSGTFSAGANPGGHGGAYRVGTASSAGSWTITAPISGPQVLSAWFVSAPSRAADALLEVNGTHRFLFDQRTHGQRWAPVGTFDLDAGQTITVRLSSPGEIVYDAIRLGAGTHTSNNPWWQMGAEVYAEYQNAPPAIQALGDVTTRPRYAEYYGADVYLSVHSNASGAADSTAAGTSVYRYNCGTFPDHSADPPPAQCDDPTGSDRLQELVHQSFIASIRGNWDANWRDRGRLVANFGELRELAGIPGILIETAFHDNVRLADGSNLRMTDNQALHDPRWRRAAAFGLYRGLSEFLAGVGGPLVLDPPSTVAALRVDHTRIEVRFSTVTGADGYRIYSACGSRTFDQGRIYLSSPAILDNLPAEAACGFKIASLNAAGEGLPSKIVSARPSGRRSQILVIDGFDREDAWVQTIDNKHDTAFHHGLAIAEHAFDGATESAWAAGLVDLGNYEGLILAFGRESTGEDILTPALRAQVSAFSGAVFAAGTEIAWTLDARGDADGREFLDSLFGARYENDDAASPALRPAAGGLFANLPASMPLDDGTAGGIPTKFADVFAITASATAVLNYDDGTSIAAIQKGRNVILGVALENITLPPTRAALLTAWADQIPIAPIDPTPDGGVIVADAGVDAGLIDTSVVDVGLEEDAAFAPDAQTPADAAPAQDAEVPSIELLVAASADPVRGGCGCSTTSTRTSSALWIFLLGLIWMMRRNYSWVSLFLAACGQSESTPPPEHTIDSGIVVQNDLAFAEDASEPIDSGAEIADSGAADSGVETMDAGAPDSGGADSVANTATFTRVWAVIRPNCSCHVTGSTAPVMRDQARAYTALVDVRGTGSCGSRTRVVPFDADNSVLYQKVAGVDLCGTRMPRGRAPLSAGQIQLIADWIDAGAAND